jgi:polar amino acid transport system permease protein
MTYQPSALQLQREAAKRRASRRSIFIALTSTLGMGFLITVLVTGAQGYEKVKESF